MSLKVGPPRSDDIGPWSQEKLDLLEKYLVAYAKIMYNQKKKWLKATLHIIQIRYDDSVLSLWSDFF